MDFVDANGSNKWAEFSKLIGTKTRFACRCRYSTLTKFLQRNPDAELKDAPRKEKKKLTNVNFHNYLEEASKLKAAREDPTKASKKSSIPQEKPLKMVPKGRIFSDKAGQQLCEVFKYSYNWRFIPDRIPRIFSNEDSERTFTMLQLLDFELDLNQFQTNFTQLTPENQTNLTLALNVDVSPEMKDEIRYIKTFGNKIPINLNTVLAWRAMQMMVLDKPLVKVERPQTGNYAGKYNLFIRRFKQIFYWTALLSKLDPRIVKERLMLNVPTDEWLVENDSLYSDEENENENKGELIDVPTEVEEKIVMEFESDEENAVDFLLSHIKTKAETEKNKNTEPLDMPFDDFDFEETEIDIEETSVKNEEPSPRKRKCDSPIQDDRPNEFKKPKRIAAKSMPLT